MKTLSKIAFLVLLMAATSCASRKKTVAPTPPQTFEWMTSKLDIQAEGNGMAFDDMSGQIRMRKDSLVWLSVTATMGMEVLRAKVSNDSVWIVNRLEKTYLTEPLDTVSAQLGMSLSLPLVQTLLLDNNEGLPPVENHLPLVQTLLLDNNEGLPPVENQTVLLKTFVMGNLSAKMRYKNIKLDEKTSFPLKISDKMERFRIKRRV